VLVQGGLFREWRREVERDAARERWLGRGKTSAIAPCLPEASETVADFNPAVDHRRFVSM
jgi:hypothetical protein